MSRGVLALVAIGALGGCAVRAVTAPGNVPPHNAAQSAHDLNSVLARPHSTLALSVAHGLASAYVQSPLQPLPRRRFDVLLSVLRHAPSEERTGALDALVPLRRWHPAMVKALAATGPHTIPEGVEAGLARGLTSGDRAEVTAVFRALVSTLGSDGTAWTSQLADLARENRCPLLSLRDWAALARSSSGHGDHLPCTPSPAMRAMRVRWQEQGPAAVFSDLDAGRIAVEDVIPDAATRDAPAAPLWSSASVLELIRRVRALPSGRRELAAMYLPEAAARAPESASVSSALLDLARSSRQGSRAALMDSLQQRTSSLSEASLGELWDLRRAELGLVDLESGDRRLAPTGALRLFAWTRHDVGPKTSDPGPMAEGASMPAFDFALDADAECDRLAPEESAVAGPLMDLCANLSQEGQAGASFASLQGGCSSVVTRTHPSAASLSQYLGRARGMFLLRLVGETFRAEVPPPRDAIQRLAEDPLTRAPLFALLKSQHASGRLFPPEHATETAMLESIVAGEVALALQGAPHDVERTGDAFSGGRHRIDVRFRVHRPRPGAEREWMVGFVLHTGRDLRDSPDAAFYTLYGSTPPTRFR